MREFSRPQMNSHRAVPKGMVKKRQQSCYDIDNIYCRQLTTSVKKTKPLTMHDYKKFKEVSNIETKYKIGDTLGSGAFGQVRRCIHIDTGNEFAVKIMEKKMIA